MKLSKIALALAAMSLASAAMAVGPTASITGTDTVQTFAYSQTPAFGPYELSFDLATGYTYDLVFNLSSAYVIKDGGVAFGHNPESIGFFTTYGFTTTDNGAFGGGELYTDNATFKVTGLTPALYKMTIFGFGAGTLTGSVAVANAIAIPAAPVPEPETYAMMLAGLGVIGMMARRRQRG